MPAQEGAEALLQRRAPGAGGVFFEPLEGKADPADSAASGVAVDKVREREPIAELTEFHLA